MFGNILLVLVALSYGGLVNLMAKPAPGGDYSVGYSFVWLIVTSGFLVSSGLLAWNLNLNQCFDWAPPSFLRYRNWLVFLGWATFALTILWGLEYKSKWHEGEFPSFMRWLAVSKVYLWLPLLLLVPAVYLLNTQRETGFAPVWVRLLVQVGFTVSLLIGLGIFYGFAKASVQRRIALHQAAEKSSNSESWAFNSSMDYINNYKEEGIQGLLTYTHHETEARLRAAALAKIKSHAGWEVELLQILEQGPLSDKYWVIAFLDANEPEHPRDFIQPVNNCIPELISGVKESFSDPYSLHLGYINIEALCRVLDTHFKDSAAVFRPNILKLQKTLDANPPARKSADGKEWFDLSLPKYRAAVKNWLDANQ